MLTSALHACFPLSRVSVNESLLDGVSEARVVIPSDAGASLEAKQRAKATRVARLLGALWLMFAGVCALSYSHDLYVARRTLG